MSFIIDVFTKCYDAIRSGKLIQRESRRDKEYHFQDWFRARLAEIGEHFGELTRIEAQTLILGYEFDLATHTISAKTTPNPSAGKTHKFVAGRVKNEPGTPVSLASH